MTKPKTIKSRYRVEHKALQDAIIRCTRTCHPQYKDYGDRGITVDPAFMDKATGFQAFLDEVGPKPAPHLSLDRINNDKGYEPGNLGWVDRFGQARSQRERQATVLDLGWGMKRVSYITEGGRANTLYSPVVPAHGETMSLIEWSWKLGVSTSTLSQRLGRGWTPDQAMVATIFKPKGAGYTPKP